MGSGERCTENDDTSAFELDDEFAALVPKQRPGEHAALRESLRTEGAGTRYGQ